jgi:hypothetical protein
MVSFVEQATLRLIDDSSRKTRLINRELNALFRTVNKFKSRRIDIRVKTSGVKQIVTDLKKLDRQHRIKLDSRELDRATAKSQRLNNLLGKAHRTGAPALAAGVRNPPGGRRGGGIRTGAAIGIPGLPAAFGISGGGLQIATAALTIGAATLTAKTLVLQGIQRERAQQQLAGTTTTSQMAALGSARSGKNVPITDLEFQNLAAGFLADTSGNVKAARVLAERSIQSAQDLARVRGISFADALGEVGNSLVKSVGQVTTDMVDSSGKLTKRAAESFDTFDKVLAVQPTLAPRDVPQVTAGLGPQRQTIDQSSLFRSLFLAGDFGTKFGNQARQAMLGLGGQQKKQSNEALQALGIDQNDPRIETDFTAFLIDTLLPKLEKNTDNFFKTRGIVPTETERNARLSKEIQPIIGRQTGQNAVSELLASRNALNRAEAQANAQFAEADRERAEALSSWTNQLEVSGKRITELFGKLGDTIGTGVSPAIEALGNGAQKLQSLITNPTSGEVDPRKAAGVIGGTTLAALLGGKKVIDLFNPLTTSARALDGSAVALTRAAIALGGRGVAGQGLGIPSRRGGGKVSLPTGATGGLLTNGLGLFAYFDLIKRIPEQITDLTNLSKEEKARAIAVNQAQAKANEDATNSLIRDWIRKVPVVGNPLANNLTGSSVTPATTPNVAKMTVDQLLLPNDKNRKDFGALEPGRINSATDEMRKIMAIEKQEAAQKPAFLAGQLKTEMDTASSNFATVMQIGGTNLQQGVQEGVTNALPSLTNAGASMGANFLAAINTVAIGEAIGNAAASRISSAAANVSINVKQPEVVNTGVSAPVE